MIPLTDVQARILTAIRRCMTDAGRPPTVTELARTAGIASSDVVIRQLRILQAKGYLRPVPGTRAVQILDPQETSR